MIGTAFKKKHGAGQVMTNDPSKRWEAFTPWELQALDEFFRSFADNRPTVADIGKIGREISAEMQRREIPAFGSKEPLASKVKAPGPRP
jgi:hypothetical protein